LDVGTVGAAGLDAFEHEPAVDDRYLTLKNAFLMPHLGAARLEARIAIVMLTLGGLTAPRLLTV
jgi:lactate dehydrogenase-like 2-hydroxyacid dehydrogenase